MMKTIYELSLHETLNTDFGMAIMRVQTGWIYDCWDYSNDCPKKGTFVPYTEELLELKQEIKKRDALIKEAIEAFEILQDHENNIDTVDASKWLNKSKEIIGDKCEA